MFDQRPMEVLASYLVAILTGVLLHVGVQFYAESKVKTALKEFGEEK